MQQAVLDVGARTRKAELVKWVCDYLRENSASKLTLRSLGDEFGLSPFYLQRVFTGVMGMSPRRYLEEYRLSDLRSRLSKGEPVLGALRSTGYSAQSWLYEDSRKRLGMTPATYRKGGEGTDVGYAIGDSSLGRLLVATTEHGVCSVKAGGGDDELLRALLREFPKARIAKSTRAVGYLASLRAHLEGQSVKFPLDVSGTNFQMRVWSALRSIPLGETRSYFEVAKMVGEPRAVRAVANACASNPVPLIIPCHRVIRKDGSLGGYGLGVGRKKALLKKERSLAASRRQDS
ncbi:MAG: methylated-DNA--[protein]-cysteine S-methyltransferase [Nitrososphaerota archaeon]|nr:methylated-DNA--[protein]-cysteine S-methyltransferase [Nitrososphaerota archaeon]MDG6975522.1 methylated-DNA--[protein]-cysteine S-methyltransferase [Nitrososphaerota archaeon]MDG7009677.1 methylated-DNA--[protein]-cysteine S-methyltransferase [Nitrososphaerota archaeon]MDG7026978.1 methylated-DNA--[protein]-cysteine S-methyltransferase [Nitrososphaerota archaeon]